MVQVAQASRSFLDVGFEVGFLITRVALLLLQPLGLHERKRIERGDRIADKLPVERAIAGE